MTARRYALLPATLLAATLALSGCSGSDAAKPKPEPTATANTQDGAIPLSVLTSWLDNARAGRGDLSCGFTTENFQKATVATATDAGLLTDGSGTCPAAVAALAKANKAPEKVSEFVIDVATDDTTTITLIRAVGAKEQASLVNEDGSWLLDTVLPAK